MQNDQPSAPGSPVSLQTAQENRPPGSTRLATIDLHGG